MEKLSLKIGANVSEMKLTTGQRLRTLERETVVLRDTIKVLHNMLKNQRSLINEYITEKMVSSEAQEKDKNNRPELETYTFVCKRRFDKMEVDIRKTLQLLESVKFRTKAG